MQNEIPDRYLLTTFMCVVLKTHENGQQTQMVRSDLISSPRVLNHIGSRVQDARQISDLFVKPKQSITPIIAISELLITLEALNHSIYRYIGVAVSAQIAIRPSQRTKKNRPVQRVD